MLQKLSRLMQHGKTLPADILDGYLDVIADMPDRTIAYACRMILRRDSWYPRPAELRDECKRQATGYRLGVVSTVPPCLTCADTGWQSVQKDGHGYLRPCPCRASNEAWKASQARLRV